MQSNANKRNGSIKTNRDQMMQIPQSEEDWEEDEFIDNAHHHYHHEGSPPTPTLSHADQVHMQKKIKRWRQIVNSISVALLVVSSVIITLYFTTDLFDEYKKQQQKVDGGLSELEHEMLSDSCRKAKTDMDSYDSCVDGCQSHLCCFEAALGEDSSSASKNNKDGETCAGQLECADYDMCAELQAILSQQIDWPLEVNAACDDDGVKGDVGKKCQKMCEKSQCCFELGEKNCYQGREEFCDMYAACEELNMGADMFGIGVGPVIISKANP